MYCMSYNVIVKALNSAFQFLQLDIRSRKFKQFNIGWAIFILVYDDLKCYIVEISNDSSLKLPTVCYCFSDSLE